MAKLAAETHCFCRVFFFLVFGLLGVCGYEKKTVFHYIVGVAILAAIWNCALFQGRATTRTNLLIWNSTARWAHCDSKQQQKNVFNEFYDDRNMIVVNELIRCLAHACFLRFSSIDGVEWNYAKGQTRVCTSWHEFAMVSNIRCRFISFTVSFYYTANKQ